MQFPVVHISTKYLVQLRISTEQTGPEIAERDARPLSIRIFVPSNTRNDS